MADLEERLTNLFVTLSMGISSHLENCRNQLNDYHAQLRYAAPTHRISSEQQHLDHLTMRMNNNLLQYISTENQRAKAYQQQLEILNPHNVLQRGYAILQTEDGIPVTSVGNAAIHQNLTAVLQDGTLEVDITRITPKKENNHG